MRKTTLLLVSLLTALSGPALSQSNLRDLDGRARSVQELVAQPGTEAVVLVIWCSQCGSCRGNEGGLEAYSAAGGKSVRVYAVDPHPTDSPERIRKFLKSKGLKLQVLRDPNQSLIKGLKIDRTTTALVYDKKGQLRYFGPFQGEGKGYAADAVTQIRAGDEVTTKSRPLSGCPIPSL